ncbi:glycosyltransferase family 2 protein [Demequina sp. TTPB684]|uniref:glycosyltransferase family 2 protein n=1 Tax=unclassified Demequina TaxID=2620311 RepID=UPI001CF47151|nr:MULTISPECIES: glycosyltransferase family 2 protein [unclassified Demequina]MCB2413776.1 glycosyltransferase family 2 protein [Demequina sp. TTPB684]UPU89316.1 glycosyltransferase family 2 protein [Demequina sp. TMPB413]
MQHETFRTNRTPGDEADDAQERTTTLVDAHHDHHNALEELEMAHHLTDTPSEPPRPPRRRRRQWGAEKPRPPLPAIEKPATTAATWMGGLAIVATVVAFVAYLALTTVSQFIDNGIENSSYAWQSLGYVLVMGFLIFSTFSYLLARQGALYRSRGHVRVPRAEIDAFMARTRRSLTTLVPSYAEDASVVRATLMSAALQEYPVLRVVLLLDDPPHPSDPAAAKSLDDCRALPGEIQTLLNGPYERFSASLVHHEKAAADGGAGTPDQIRALALDFVWAAAWLREHQTGYERTSNADDFLADEVLGGLAGDFESTSQALFAALDQQAGVPAARLAQLCRRLVWTFDVQISSFERKAYANLPHDANKAMNLNAYIGLMGRKVRRVETRAGAMLRQTEADDGILIPDSDYLLTLDADSVLLREYCLRLVHHMEMPGNERIGVVQTPYSAFRGATTRLERIAAATTDIQHILHQGLTYFDATFWVGANAVIRKSALDDIVEVSYVGGQEIRRYVQDHTVIEDTESSIDLISHGWSLYNYPERLSYSATPPDFGSLAVQRARWANGGLLIAPKYRRYLRSKRKEGQRVRRASVALRLNYMASISWASVGLLFLLMFPFDDRLLSPIIVAAALPYFIAMSSDFKRLGYKRTDVFRVYAFNLILLPVNLSGTIKSLQQAAAKSKIAFARTPKVSNRTAAPALYILAAYFIAAFSFLTLANDIRTENWSHAVFAGFNGLLTTYAIGAFIGFRNSIVDIVLGAIHWVQVPRKPRRSAPPEPAPQLDWESVLYFGPDHVATSDNPPQVAVTPTAQPRHGDTRSRQRTS